MGVTGLLQQLKEIQQPTTLSQFKGKTLAVDTYGWLHRGLILCAQDLCTNVPTRSYVTSVMKKVDMLRHFGVEPYMVFDGSPLPTKKATELERRKRREQAREAATKSMARGDRKSAWKEFMKAAEVTPEMAKSIMVELDRKHVKYVVAPYEADPQMVYLEQIGLVDGILSEDSDLLVFGCKRLITKLNDYGECIEIDRSNFHKVKKLTLGAYTDAQWRLVAILSGCDYTKGIPGVGLKTAFNLVLRVNSLEKIVLALKADNKTVPDDFLEEALMADLAFQFQKVFNPRDRRMCTLQEYPETLPVDFETIEMCCGKTLEPHILLGICTGKIHPDCHTTLISREQNLMMQKSASVVVQSKKAEVATVSQSFSGTKSIASYFSVEKTVKTQLKDTTLKRVNERTVKLSPSSKKLKRLEGETKTGAHSKFFGSAPPKLAPLVQQLQPSSPPQPNVDSSFFTGDSEVPEESSPIKKTDNTSAEPEYLTDMDDDLDDSPANSMANSMIQPPLFASTTKSMVDDAASGDEGYVNEIDESPVKITQTALLWRERFSLGSGDGEATKTLQTKYAKVTRKVEEVGCSDLTESSSSPQTPEDCVHESQGKSLQRDILSESEEEIVTRRTEKSSFNLLRFAFTGR